MDGKTRLGWGQGAAFTLDGNKGIYHSVDTNGAISLVTNQKGYFRVIQTFESFA